MKEAIEDGVPLIGYTTWGLIDLVSAGTGQYAKRYGFIYVDRHDDGTGDFSRSKKNSFYWYKKFVNLTVKKFKIIKGRCFGTVQFFNHYF